MAKNVQNSTTQLFLDIYDITNDFLILGDGAVSLVISVSAMNFGLLSDNEQDATIYAYAALLNSLSFPIQIVVRSQPKDVTGYLKRVQEQEEATTNPIYKQRIKEYRTFVESLVQEQNVLDKKFYIVVPLSAVEMGLTTQSVIPGSKNKPLSSFEKNYIIEKAKTNLTPRRDHLIDQLARIGLYSRQLNTQELIQMLYSSYNPESFEGQKVTDTSNYTTPLVQAKIQGDFSMTTPTTPNQGQPFPAAPSAPDPMTQTTPPAAAPAGNAPAASGLGFTTPTNMDTQPSAPVSPVTQATPTPPVTPPPAPVSPIAETPVLSIPNDKTPGSPAEPMAATDPQQILNQTLGQMGTPPVVPSTPPASPTPAAPSTPPNQTGVAPQPMIDN